MRVRSAAASALVAAACAAGACQDGARPGADAGATQVGTPGAPPSAPPGATPHASGHAAAEPPPAPQVGDASAPPVCRVVSSEGGPGPTADASAWTTLPEKASFSIRNRETGKEVRFEGPGSVRPCGGDVTLVAAGTAATFPGAGEAPGNELWVATPCAVARWAGGVHRVTVDKDGCKIQASLGSAWLWVPEGSGVEDADAGAPSGDGGSTGGRLSAPEAGWRRLDARHAVRVRAPSGADAPVQAVLACEAAVRDVTSIAARMSDGGADGGRDLGALTVESIAARRRARAACALAAARVRAAGSGAGAAKAPRPDLEGRVSIATQSLTGAP